MAEQDVYEGTPGWEDVREATREWLRERESPARLWHDAEEQAAGDPVERDRIFEKLMRDHGHIVDKTCGHEGRCACQNLPCGWPGEAVACICDDSEWGAWNPTPGCPVHDRG